MRWVSHCNPACIQPKYFGAEVHDSLDQIWWAHGAATPRTSHTPKNTALNLFVYPSIPSWIHV